MLDRSQLVAAMGSLGLSRVGMGLVLADEAESVYERLNQAESLGLSMSEETITETLLLNIARDMPANVRLKSFNKYEEGHETGADWEWWFGDGVGSWWVGMRVQAKKLHELAGARHGYDLAYKSAKAAVRQIDRLIANADVNSMDAVYALYNDTNLDLAGTPSACCRFATARAKHGISLLSAAAAKGFADASENDQQHVNGATVPLSCSVLCTDPQYNEWHFAPQGGPAEFVPSPFAFGFARLLLRLHGQDPSELTFPPNGRQANAYLRGLRRWDDLPTYVRQIHTSRGDDVVRPGAFGVPQNLAGIMVVSPSNMLPI